MIRKKIKELFINLAKVGFALLLIGWLIYSGKLDFSQLSIVLKKPSILIMALGYWFVCSAILGTQRWRLLVTAAGYKLRWMRAFNLQVMGFFFNTAMPGAVGGDLVKVYYVVKDNPDQHKAKAFLSILLDRIVGLAGVFSIGLVVILCDVRHILASPVLTSITTTLCAFSAGLLLFFGAALYHYQGDDPFLRLFDLPLPGISFFRKIYVGIREYRYHRMTILYTLLISFFNQVVALCFFYYIAITLIPAQTDFVSMATVFPLGLTVTALPLTPGGLGIGHVAFEKLFNVVGLAHGANIFNVYALIQIPINLLGVIPYLYMNKTDPKPAEIVLAE